MAGIWDDISKDYFNPEKKADPGFWSSFPRVAGQLVQGAGSTLRDLGAQDVGQSIEEYGAGVVRRNPSGVNSLADVVESPWLTTRESVGEAVGQGGAMLGAGLAGRYVGGLVGGLAGPVGAIVGQQVGATVGGLLPIATQTYGGIRVKQREQGINDVGRAVEATVPAVALERLGGAERVVGSLLKSGTGGLAREAGDKLLPHMGRQALRGGLEEFATEVPQTALERYGAYEDLNSADAWNDYAVSGIKGALGGAGIRGGAAGLAGIRRPRVEDQPNLLDRGGQPTVVDSNQPRDGYQPGLFDDLKPDLTDANAFDEDIPSSNGGLPIPPLRSSVNGPIAEPQDLDAKYAELSSALERINSGMAQAKQSGNNNLFYQMAAVRDQIVEQLAPIERQLVQQSAMSNEGQMGLFGMTPMPAPSVPEGSIPYVPPNFDNSQSDVQRALAWEPNPSDPNALPFENVVVPTQDASVSQPKRKNLKPDELSYEGQPLDGAVEAKQSDSRMAEARVVLRKANGGRWSKAVEEAAKLVVKGDVNALDEYLQTAKVSTGVIDAATELAATYRSQTINAMAQEGARRGKPGVTVGSPVTSNATEQMMRERNAAEQALETQQIENMLTDEQANKQLEGMVKERKPKVGNDGQMRLFSATEMGPLVPNTVEQQDSQADESVDPRQRKLFDSMGRPVKQPNAKAKPQSPVQPAATDAAPVGDQLAAAKADTPVKEAAKRPEPKTQPAASTAQPTAVKPDHSGSDKLFDQIKALKEQNKALLRKDGRPPVAGTEKRKQFDANQAEIDRLMPQWDAAYAAEKKAAKPVTPPAQAVDNAAEGSGAAQATQEAPKPKVSKDDKAEIDSLLDVINAPAKSDSVSDERSQYNRVRSAIQQLQEWATDSGESAGARAYAKSILENEVDQRDIDNANLTQSEYSKKAAAEDQLKATARRLANNKFRTNRGDAKTGSIGKERALEIVQKVLRSLGITDSVDIQVVGKPEDIGVSNPGAAGAYGVTLDNGRIVLFADNLTSDIEAFKTIFHELFHLGLSKTLGQGSYIQSMLKFKTDALVRQYAERWKKSEEGQAKKGTMPTNNYEALAVEEALADIGEALSLGNLGSKEMKPFVRSTVQVLASVADAFGLKPVAQAIRRMSYTQAEKFVVDTIASSGAESAATLRPSRFRNARESMPKGVYDPLAELKDRFDDVRKGWRYTPELLGFLSLDQIADRFPEMTNVQNAIRGIQRMGARMRSFVEMPADLRKQWSALHRADQAMTGKLNRLFVDTTRLEVWVDGKYDNPMLDKRNAHLKTDDKAELAKITQEAMRLRADWNSLSPAHQKLYGDVLAELRKQFDAKQNALLKRIIDGYKDDLANVASPEELAELARLPENERDVQKFALKQGASFKDGQTLSQFLADVDTNFVKPSEVPGPYFPLTRRGKFVMVKKGADFKKLEAALEAAHTKFGEVYGRTVNSIEDAEAHRKELAEAKKALGEARQKLRDAKSNADQYIVKFFDSRTRAEREAVALGADPAEAVFARQEFFNGMDTVSPALVNRLSNTIGKQLGTEVSGDVAKAVRQFLISALPDRSQMKNEMERMKVEGVDAAEAMHSFLEASHKNAWVIARLENSVALADALHNARAASKDDERIVGNEMAKRFAKQMEYSENNALVDMAANVSHMSFLGMSIGYYVQNALQPWVVTLPWLSARYGMRRSGAELMKATGEVTKALQLAYKGGSLQKLSTRLDYSLFDKGNGEQQMLRDMLEEGLIDITIRADKGGMFSQSDNKLAMGLETLSDAVAFPPHMVEVVNRISTALAAYRMAMDTNKGKMDYAAAVTASRLYAERALQQTQVDYTTENAPRFMNPNMMGGLGRLAFQFKRYQQAMAFLWAKTAIEAYREVKAGKADKENLRMLAYMSGMTLGTSGLAGLPVAGPAGLLLWAFSKMDDDDEEKDLAQMFYAGMKEYAGEAVADAVRYGLPTTVGVNLSAKLGFGQTYDTGMLEKVKRAENGQEMVGALAAMLFGPTGGMVSNWVDAMSTVGDDPVKSIAKIMPVGIKNAVEAGLRAYGDGLTDRKGNVLLTPEEQNTLGLLAKSIGFGESTEVKSMYDARSAMLESEAKVKTVRDKLLRKAVKAREKGEGMQDAMDEIAAFNERQPTNRILPKHIVASWKQERIRQKELVSGVRVRERSAGLASAYGLTSD